ncbi:hypothetical protein SAMN04488128_101984 [Chitinophaga eiseniae]|uniref:Uncharacterized protein n=1 Tax=Chitinophaga eiseniae TaxID=634771 RepID=A0A1T4M848_9BACT|nr:hypothetical protein SAMN04488128_101984 [Chitinophaga eiseniae]
MFTGEKISFFIVPVPAGLRQAGFREARKLFSPPARQSGVCCPNPFRTRSYSRKQSETAEIWPL